MPATMKQIPRGRASHWGWIELSTGSYADPNMLVGIDGRILTNINFYQGNLAAQRLGLRFIDDREFNDLVNAEPEVAEQMCIYAVWTSFLKDVERRRNGYKAKYIARPEVSKKGDTYFVSGSERSVKLPKTGWFDIRELLESDTGLPTQTYSEIIQPDLAYFEISAGKKRPVFRGNVCPRGRKEFGIQASWGPSNSYWNVGARVASDNEPSIITMATREALAAIEEIRSSYDLKSDIFADALSKVL